MPSLQNPSCKWWDMRCGSILGREDPMERKWQPTPICCLGIPWTEEPVGRPMGQREPDTAEHDGMRMSLWGLSPESFWRGCSLCKLRQDTLLLPHHWSGSVSLLSALRSHGGMLPNLKDMGRRRRRRAKCSTVKGWRHQWSSRRVEDDVLWKWGKGALEGLSLVWDKM